MATGQWCGGGSRIVNRAPGALIDAPLPAPAIAKRRAARIDWRRIA